jgi:hypothetical protein
MMKWEFIEKFPFGLDVFSWIKPMLSLAMPHFLTAAYLRLIYCYIPWFFLISWL